MGFAGSLFGKRRTSLPTWIKMVAVRKDFQLAGEDGNVLVRELRV